LSAWLLGPTLVSSLVVVVVGRLLVKSITIAVKLLPKSPTVVAAGNCTSAVKLRSQTEKCPGGVAVQEADVTNVKGVQAAAGNDTNVPLSTTMRRRRRMGKIWKSFFIVVWDVWEGVGERGERGGGGVLCIFVSY